MATRDHIELLELVKRGQNYLWFYRPDQVPLLYRALQKAVCDPLCQLDWSDIIHAKTCVQERLRQLSREVTP